MKYSQSGLMWFFLGLGMNLQLVSSLSMTELIVLILGPVFFFQDLPQLRRNGIMPFLCMSLLTLLGCVFACLYNHTPSYFFFRGVAVTTIIPCAIVVTHRMLTRRMAGYKWMFVGMAISMVLSTFVFQAAVETTMLAKGATGSDAVDDIVSGPLFWIKRIYPFVKAPINGWYLQTPTTYSVIAPLAFAAFSMISSASGRSSALGALAASFFVLIGAKRIDKMRRVSRYFGLWLLLAFISVFIANFAYRTLALNGILGERQREKYVVQSRGSTSVWQLIIGGRIGSVVGYVACLDNPIIGFGAMPVDDKGYYQDFLINYGTYEDVDEYVRNEAFEQRMGISRIRMIPCHTSVGMFWVEYGIFGLLLWIYVIYVLVRYLRQDIDAVPQWFGWIAFSIPAFLWDAFFSPFSSRIMLPLFITACLVARAVRKGLVKLPAEMVLEIIEVERKSR